MRLREICIRYRKSEVSLDREERFMNSEQVFIAFGNLSLEPVEVFCAIFLDNKNRMLCVQQIARGTLSSCLVHPREVFCAAVQLQSAAIITIHNHPSGDPEPSKEDIQITSRLKETGRILGIQLIDHIIIGDQNHFSFADQGLL